MKTNPILLAMASAVKSGIATTGRVFLNEKDFKASGENLRVHGGKLEMMFSGRAWTLERWDKRGFAVECEPQ